MVGVWVTQKTIASDFLLPVIARSGRAAAACGQPCALPLARSFARRSGPRRQRYDNRSRDLHLPFRADLVMQLVDDYYHLSLAISTC